MLKQLVFSVIGIGAVGTLSLCDSCTPRATAATVVASANAPTIIVAMAMRTATPDAKTVHLEVAGMTCGGCVVGTRTVLSRLNGVTKAEVSYDKQDAVVTFHPAKVTIAQIVAAIKTLGYTATVVAD